MEKLTSITARAMTLVLLTLSLSVSQALAVVPAAEMLPETTCMFVSCPDMNKFQASFDRTQLGLLAQDPVMKPFADDLAAQLKDRFGRTEIEFGVKWGDLKGVWGGEACLARVQPGNDKTDHASILIIDVTGKDAQVAKVREAIATNMSKRKATIGKLKMGAAEVTGYTLPRKRGHVKAAEAYLTVFENQLIVTNHAKLMADVLKRAESKATEGSLASLKMFSEVMTQVEAEAEKLAPHVRWFVNPFKLAEVVQASQRGRGTRVRNLSATLAKQGFDAIRGVGGHVNLATNGYEAIHRTFVFAPPVTGAATKYVAAARMLFFPTSSHSPTPAWLPRNLATYTSLNWRVLDGFNYSVPLLEEVINSEFIEELLKDMNAEVGVDFRADLMAHLDDHIISCSDFRLPITTNSERLLIAIRVKRDKVAEVQKALDLLGDFEPQARPLLIAGQKGWEIVSPEEADADLSDIELPSPGIPLPGGAPPAAKAENELALPNAAVVISTGWNAADSPYLFISTDVDLLHEVLTKREKFNTLGQSDDFKFVSKLLKELGAEEDCIRTFSRSDEEFRSTYEMIRQGKMPQSESMLGKLLNVVLGPDDKSVRKPEVKGEKLPDYQIVRRYLGPSGVFVQPHANGWSVIGIMVSKQQVLDDEEASSKSILTSSSQ